jgi:hypothetical protein
MDVICFLYVSLGSSIVQLHDSLGSRLACTCLEVGFSGKNGARAWCIYYQRAAFCCGFFWAKGLNAKDIHIEIFPIYGGKCLSHKAVLNWPRILSRTFEIRPWCPTRYGSGWDNSKKFQCCGIRRTGKAMGQVYQCWWRICREINVFFPDSNIIYFKFYIHLWPTYWLSVVDPPLF